MDVVITYVDSSDKYWQQDFKTYCKNDVNELAIDPTRFDTRNNLKYCLRSIAKNMPFVNKVFLVVSRPSQVPNWINTEEVNVIYHKDILPETCLPTFNSRTIEMCLHKIPGLSEEFVYFNDDMFVLNACTPTDLFLNGKINNHISVYTEHELAQRWGRSPIYFNPHKRCTDEVKKLLNIKDSDQYYLTNHGPSPMLKTDNIELFESLSDVINPTLNQFRTETDFVHFMYSIYSYLKGNVNVDKKLTNLYINLNTCGLNDLYRKIYSDDLFMCFNDIKSENSQRECAIDQVKNDLLQMLFPNACKYEIKPKVSVCVIVKNENKYLTEYINHYLNLGFSTIYIYDNNDIDGENPQEILSQFDRNKCVYIDYRGKTVCQKAAYNHCYSHYGNTCDWIAFFDADEFLELPLNDNIGSFIADFQNTDYNCVFVNWICYGDNGHLYYENKPIQERFTKRSSNEAWFNKNIPLHYYVKSIVKTNIHGISFKESVHYPNSNSVRACNSNKKPCLLANYQNPAVSKAYLKHYITKSLEEWVNKIKRGYPDHIVDDVKYNQYLERYFIINSDTEEKRNLLTGLNRQSN